MSEEPSELRKAADELAREHRGQQSRVDIRPAEDQSDLAPAIALRFGQHRRQPGRAAGLRYATSVEGFASALGNETVAGGAAGRLALFRHFHDQEVEVAQVEATTRNLGSGSAQLFLAPSDLNLNLFHKGAAAVAAGASEEAADAVAAAAA